MDSDAQKLCLTCGLCCNGVIFGAGELQPGDDLAGLKAAGLRLKRGSSKKFVQPCAALDGCRCTVYDGRPSYCRQFECALLKAVLAGEMTGEKAAEVIRRARARAAKVDRLLRRLGDKDDTVALSLRFRRAMKRLNPEQADRTTSRLVAELTVAMHRLNLLLSEAFYP